MKKRIGVVVLAVVLLAAVAGTVFALGNGDNVPYTFNNWGMTGLRIEACRLSFPNLVITYSSSEAYGKVMFKFTAKDQSGNNLDTWFNDENITKPRASSTWRWPMNIRNLASIEISASRY